MIAFKRGLPAWGNLHIADTDCAGRGADQGDIHGAVRTVNRASLACIAGRIDRIG